MFKKVYEKGIGIIVMKFLVGGVLDNVILVIKYILFKDYIDVVILGMESVE